MPSPQIKARPALMEFGRQLRRARMEAGIDQRQLSKRCGIGYRFISLMELGRQNPSLATIVLLAEGIGCKVTDFFRDN
jgi:transcriptional regulator with XRE-family HTH domain